jgi:hypothetical protein
MFSLVLFLTCVQFLNSCVQFLMDTILNLSIVQFFMKKNGGTHYRAMFHISREGRCALWGCILYLRKREMHVMGVRLPFN